MRFRVTDECRFAREFDANTADELGDGIRAAWDAYMDRLPSEWAEMSAHPALRARIRLAEIDRWLRDRLAASHTDDQKRAWVGQAAKWRRDAERDFGSSAAASPLRLHLWHGFHWISMPSGPPRVARHESAERLDALFAASCRLEAHADAIDRMFPATMALSRPTLRLV